MFVEESDDDAESIIVLCNCIFVLSPHTSYPLNSRISEQPVVSQLWQVPSPIALMSSGEGSAQETSSGSSCESSGGDDISGDGTSEESDEDSEDQRITGINSVLSSTEEEESSGEET